MRTFAKMAAVVMVGALALTGCGKTSSEKDNNASGSSSVDVCKGSKGEPKVGVAYDVGGRGDQSFNDSAYRGLEKAVKDLGASCIEAKATTSDNDSIREQRLQTLADQGFNPVIAVGFLYSPAAAKVAKANPNTNFAVIDGYSTTIATDAKNLSDLVFAENEGSYLVGVAAALTSKSKHVGFIGGTHGDLIKKFEAGYVAGVKSIDPKIKIDIQYLTEDPSDAATGFENPAGGKQAATAMYQGGADVVYHAAGKSGLGLFEAAVAAGEGKWAIGVDSDQYLTAAKDQQPHILTSMLKRIDTAVFEFVTAFKEGKVQSGFVNYDLKVDGVGYSTSGGFVDPIKAQIDAAADKIKSGEVKVPEKP
ncbi:MAG TPA: BMP family ABC transporter substrate-binding protein [Marmoricola sp.]|nr:BMP family ABC transporter substrate-binding protein [Nocardioidaceae bacterium]MCB8993342.1 BMP family ABC transporter substrate-binding protein [Nocardioidaceae bacterium]MCO5323782.1 BMP family ABC transporter substrate-binding protein [Nocardioidaceae bacterium]HRV68654.1 BMP family ABC transporter substrate-binding protein [Marmoricola sp.]